MEFPYSGWVLAPSFTPKEVTFVKAYKSIFGGHYHEAQSGKRYATSDIFKTKTYAIARGHERLRAQQAALDKKQESINKRHAVLKKAAG